MSDSNNTSAITQGFSSLGAMLLFITFLVLKLTGVITWSWWWVTAPLWAGLAIIVGILLVVAVCAFTFALSCILFARDKKKAAKERMRSNAGERNLNGDT